MATRQDLANAIRALSMDAVQKANSGHPGAPMGMAEIAEVLWNHHLQHNPSNPNWANRDRFILSNGHGSMLIYSLLHLTGYDLPMDEIKTFRQLHSKCAGHPEYGYAPGVETTTGPLGQGISNAVGFAMAEKLLANQFNKPNHKIVDHHTYVFLGDGCMMEGVSHEASALAGTWGLGNLIAFWDDNGISIDGHIEGWYTDDTAKRFESYGWHVIPNVDGHDFEAINKAVEAAKKITDKPSLICCKTIIGKGSPNKSGSHDCHGSALGDAEVAATREAIGWKHDPFVIPEDVYAGWSAKDKGAKAEAAWNDKFAAYEKEFPDLANPVQLSFDNKGRLWVAVMPTYPHYKPGDPKPNDKLLILEDTDGDNKADKQTIFADNLHIPVGFEFAPEGVYISQGTNLKLYSDTNGDDKADKVEIILSGFDDHDTHHVISAFCADPSGALFMGEGVFLHTNVETPYGPVRATNGGFYRYSPQRKHLERTAQIPIPNPWGIAFDDWGQNIFAETSGPEIRWILPSTIPRFCSHYSDGLAPSRR